MMKKIAFLLVLFSSSLSFAQLTTSPKIEKKSASDTYISAIELSDKYTIVSMYFKTKSEEEQINELFENNPQLAEQYRRADYTTRRLFMEQVRKQIEGGSNEISIDPKSYITAKSGEKFSFVKATGIPVFPDNLKVQPDKRYSFKVYYERVTPGIETIDFIEGSPKRGETRQYWNFYGIKINNPAKKDLAYKPQEEKEIDNKVGIVVMGKVLDAANNQPLSAKVVCIVEKNHERYDSLRTPRTGNYIFDLSPNAYLYEISADGYETSTESFDFSKMNKTQTFTQNFLLHKKEEKRVEEKETPAIDSSKSPVEVAKNVFRLDKVYFAVGQANILPESYQQLDGLVEMMKKDEKMKIRVEGHTDNQGDAELNKKLSLDRAFNVRQYLIDKGIGGSRIQFKGYGDTRPLVANDTEENRRQNRRVEFVILEE